MAVKYGKFELPANIKVDESTKTPVNARFIAEPFERGFGHTVGNALRRIMLTSLEAPAIISLRIEGVPHEYMAVEGIIEDMTHIILNFKGALLRRSLVDDVEISREPKVYSKTLEITSEMLESNGGQYEVTLSDLLDASEFDVINPDHHLFAVTLPMKRRVDLRIGYGRGYVPSERLQLEDKQTDEIVIDAIYSPVRLVNYWVENTRVGQVTDYDRLIIEVTTDGRVTPLEALSFATQIGMAHFEVFVKVEDQTHELAFEEEELEVSTDRDALLAKLVLKINEIELSVRSTNCLQSANIETIAELVLMPESEMLRFRNFGKKSLTEIKAKLSEMGLSLGMDLSKYSITRENVGDVLEEFLKEKSGKEQ